LGLVARYIRSTNNFTELNFTIDNKSLKVGSLNSFEDYIAIKLNFGLRKQTYVSVKYLDSQHFFEIQAADFICNALWGRENYPNTDLYSPFIWRLVKKRLKFPITGFGK
ncbi:MAG: DUF3800 domain-containing protein, partial [Pelotomaculum sp.]|nr:DUF3800 domain-containing protein [Pelotomaculum sp.]